MTYPSDEWPTMPVVWFNEMPRCVGACQQGRIPCQHPLACSCTTLSDVDFDDVAAELTTDHAPLTPKPTAQRARGELPDVTAPLDTGWPQELRGDTKLILFLLLLCALGWAAVVARLFLTWSTGQ